MWEELTQPLFAGLQDACFQMTAEGSDSIEVVLTEVSDLRTTPRQEEFSIVFSGPAEPALPQGTYRLEHQETGPTELFLVPVGGDANGMRYEAVMNRLVDDETS